MTQNHQRSTSRRAFLAAGAAAALTPLAAKASQNADSSQRTDPWPDQGSDHRGIVAIASGNGLETVRTAHARLTQGVDPARAVVEGVGIVEADPDDMTVGLGGLPNERGVVELDASVMHGPLHKAGAVASLRNIVHPAQVALKVLQTTDHVMLVGEGALEFARAHGFPERDLLTPKAREAWMRWKRNLNSKDDWLDDDQLDWKPEDLGPIPPIPDGPAPTTTGTIHCSGVTSNGDLAGCTTTSGLSYKIPGRVGDSPIVGAGLYTDNEVGSAGATGRGESVIQSCGSFSVVRHMSAGLEPVDACLAVLKEIADRSIKQKRLRNGSGRPNFNVVLYALRKDGAYGSACMHEGRTYAVADREGTSRKRCAFLYPAR